MPQLRSSNNGAYKALEDEWDLLLNPTPPNNPVVVGNVEIEMIYNPGNTSPVPDEIEVRWTENNVAQQPRVFSN